MSDHGIEELLAHAGWLRGLALRLVHDCDMADELVQETWLDSMCRPPERAEAPRAWLAKVLLNRIRMRARSDGRRTAREHVSVLLADEVPGQDVLVARVEIEKGAKASISSVPDAECFLPVAFCGRTMRTLGARADIGCGAHIEQPHSDVDWRPSARPENPSAIA